MDVVSYLLAKSASGSTPSEPVSSTSVITFDVEAAETVAVTDSMLAEISVIELNGGI